jgi:DNA-binding PadR family transcriptional regulator
MRRRAGVLLPLEVEILQVIADARRQGNGWVHGFAIARMVRDSTGSKRLTAHGTLYKALARLDEAGLLEDQWEDADAALVAGRPRRRLYRLTGAGQHALATVVSERLAGVDTRIAPA